MRAGADWIAADRLTLADTKLFVDLPAIFAAIGDRAWRAFVKPPGNPASPPSSRAATIDT